MKRVMIGLAASATILSMSAGAFACARHDTTANASGSTGVIVLAQASGTSNGASSGGKAVDQQFIDPNVKSAPGTDDTSTTGSVDSSSTSGGSAATPEPTTDDSKVRMSPDRKGAPVK